jgi:hypothetical protein
MVVRDLLRAKEIVFSAYHSLPLQRPQNNVDVGLLME